ncbi:MAG: response regulator [Chitinivibrionales bacterium]
MVSKRILVIDDNPKICETMLILLKSIGMNASAATTGTDGLRKAFQEKPDLILLDVLLPDVSGRTVLEQIRTNPRTCNTSVAIFSSQVDSAVHLRERAMDVDGYLGKPFKMDELHTLIDKLTTSKLAEKLP